MSSMTMMKISTKLIYNIMSRCQELSPFMRGFFSRISYYDPTFRVRGEKAWPGNTIKAAGKHSSDAITDVTLEWLRRVTIPTSRT